MVWVTLVKNTTFFWKKQLGLANFSAKESAGPPEKSSVIVMKEAEVLLQSLPWVQRLGRIPFYRQLAGCFVGSKMCQSPHWDPNTKKDPDHYAMTGGYLSLILSN